MRKRMLIVLSIFIILVLLILINFSSRIENGSTTTKQSTIIESTDGVLYQGESVLEYQNNIYIIDLQAKMLIKYDIKSDTTSLISNFSNYNVGEQLYIVNNHFILTLDNTTYSLPLQGGNINKFTNGKVTYINDEIVMYIVQNENLQYLYITSYDKKALRITNEISYNLAKGYEISFLKQMDNSVYFNSKNSDGSASLFEVDIDSYKTTLLTRKKPLDITSELTFSDVIKIENEYFYVASNVMKTTYNELRGNSNLWRRDANSETCLDYEIENRLAINPDDENDILSEKYVSNTGEYKWETTAGILLDKYTWRDLLYGDVTKYFELNISDIYMDGKKIVTLDKEYINARLEKVIRHENGLFIQIGKDSVYEWYFCKEDGSVCNKIYEYSI